MDNEFTDILATPHSRRGMFRLAGAVGLAATFAGTLSACGSPAPAGTGGAAGAGKTITAGISYELGTNGFDPMTTSSALTLAANWHTMEGLTELLPTGTRAVYPALGKDLPTKVSDTAYEVTLRDGATFHDGSKVTVDDVVFSFERVLNPANKSLYSTFIPFIDKVTKKDDKTVAIALKYPSTLLAERLSVVKIVPKAAVTADAKAFDAKPIGTGPYKLTDNSATSKELVFEKFAGYNGKHPAKADKMVWKVMPDESTRTNALTSGAVMAIDSVPYLTVDTLKAAANVESVQGFGLLFAMFNCGSAPFNNVKNRQAIMYAIDMEKVIKTAFLGNATASTCFVDSSHKAYQKSKNTYFNQVEKAKALLAETGLKSIRMLCTDHGWVKTATPIIKESLEAVGLTVTFDQKKSADVYNTIDGKPEAYDMVIAPGDPSVFGSDADLLLRWWYAGDTWTNNRMHWKGQPSYTQVQTLLDEAGRATGDAQVAKWREIFDVVSEEIPLYPLLHRKSPTAWAKNKLVDFKPISLTGLSFVDVGVQ